MTFGTTFYQQDTLSGVMVNAAFTVDWDNRTLTVDMTEYKPTTGETLKDTTVFNMVEAD